MSLNLDAKTDQKLPKDQTEKEEKNVVEEDLRELCTFKLNSKMLPLVFTKFCAY